MSAAAGKLPSKKDFDTATNSQFRIISDAGPTGDLLLERFVDVSSNADYENFSLLFRAPVDLPPEQRIYRLEHEVLGQMDIFLVPVKLDENGLYFEAIFNQLKNA